MTSLRVIVGDCREKLLDLEPASVQCVVSSPPYWGLRDYGLPPLVWGGDASCDHDWIAEGLRTERGRGNWAQGTNGRGEEQDGGCDAAREPLRATSERADCSKCGAWRGSLGLEPTPREYVAHVVEVMRAVKRVLRRDGTLWLNFGDSYAGSRKGSTGKTSKLTNPARYDQAAFPAMTKEGLRRTGLTRKQLVGIPWRVAFALQEDGWILRSDIIWSKPCPMPESVEDRPTRAHEYVFLFARTRHYFYDASAIAEPATSTRPSGGTYRRPERASHVDRSGRVAGSENRWSNIGGTRNARSVWTIPPSPFPEAHFATFPPELARRCVLAGSRVGDVVLDPFAGAGTTALEAVGHQRHAIAIELNPEYAGLIERRLRDVQVALIPEAAC